MTRNSIDITPWLRQLVEIEMAASHMRNEMEAGQLKHVEPVSLKRISDVHKIMLEVMKDMK